MIIASQGRKQDMNSVKQCMMVVVMAASLNSVSAQQQVFGSARAMSFRSVPQFVKRAGSGDGTFYTPGLGACGQTNGPAELVAALVSGTRRKCECHSY
jgi:hypothetical protein